jgi:hypothetical protein
VQQYFFSVASTHFYFPFLDVYPGTTSSESNTKSTPSALLKTARPTFIHEVSEIAAAIHKGKASEAMAMNLELKDFKFNTVDDEKVTDGFCMSDDSLDEIITRITDAVPRKLTAEVVNGRRQALVDQIKASKNKEDIEKARRPGKLYTAKQENPDRQNLTGLFGDKLCEHMNSEVAAKIAAVSASNAIDFMFDMKDYYS